MSSLTTESNRDENSAARNRYGVRLDHRLPFLVKLRWPFRSPVVVTRLHRFDESADVRDGYPRRWHSENCWCRRG